MRRWIALLAVAAFVAPFGAVPARAQAEPEGVKLSLAEALRTALQNNLDLELARKNPLLAEQGVTVADSVFDSNLGARTTYEETQNEPFSPVDLNESKTLSAGVTWSKLLRFGGGVTLGLDSAKTDASAELFSVQSDYSARLFAEFRMPLLKGLGRETNELDLLIARNDLASSRDDLFRSALATAQEVESAYWNVVAARAAVDVARQSLKLANDLLELNRKKVEVGTLAPIEITQAEAGVASREEGVIQAETTYQATQDALRQLLAVPQDDRGWEVQIDPVDRPTFSESVPDLEAVLANALARRPEISVARRSADSARLQERAAENGVKHTLDLAAEVAPSARNNQYVDSLSDVASFDNHNWSVGLQYGYPIGNRGAKARLAQSRLLREKSELEVANAELAIRVDVRNAVRNVESGVKRVKAAQASTVLQQKKLEAEQKKFDNGMSTSFEVLTFQTDLANAQLSEIRARLDYVKALADLERAQGTLLEARGLKLE